MTLRRSPLFIAGIVIVGIGIFAAPFIWKGSLLDPNAGFLNWALIATVFVGLCVLGFFCEFERAAAGAKEIALVSMLGTISALSRVPFAVMLGFQPCGLFVVCTGYVFGPMAGFMVGCLTILISNLFLGQGPWTPYQMFSWGLVGITAAGLSRIPHLRGRIFVLVVFGFVWGYLYGFIMNIWFWTYFVYPLTLKTYLFALLNAVIWDATHALANLFFVLVFGAKVIGILERFKKRFFWTAVELPSDKGKAF
jgi:energy-coupling factor transport system substrate-specific component